MANEKLEINQLKGYLGTGLKGIEAFGKPIHILHSLDINKGAIWRNKEFPSMVGRIDCKPILHPLSDITKEIEINGEKFFPLLELAKISRDGFGKFQCMTKDVIIRHLEGHLSFRYDDENKSFTLTHFNSNLQVMGHFGVKRQLELFEKLHEWHFDVHGLIEKGLAFDINNLKE